MNLVDELFTASTAYFYYRRPGQSFSRAGDWIGLSQSAVSHSVKELERQTGVRLLDRTTREVVLTEAGQQLATRLERVLDELNSILRDAGRVGTQLTGTVRVAASQTISAHLIPQCIAQSNSLYPAIDFVLHDRPQQWVLESIRREKWILASLSIPAQRWIYSVKPSYQSLLLLCRRDHPLAHQEWVSWQDLKQASLVLQDYASGSRPLIDAALAHLLLRRISCRRLVTRPRCFQWWKRESASACCPRWRYRSRRAALQVKRLTPVVERQLMLARRKTDRSPRRRRRCGTWCVLRPAN